MGGTGKTDPSVARVTVAKRRVIPPNSVAKIKCKMDAKLSDYVIEPVGKHQGKLLIPKVIRGEGTAPVMCVVNPSDRYRLLAKGQNIGMAYLVEAYLQDEETGAENSADPEDPAYVRCVDEEEPGEVSNDPNLEGLVPEHLSQVFAESCKQLDDQQQDELAKLLVENQDVFAKSEFDLGDFSAIEHTIDTGDAKPIQLRMRRTPPAFVKEEEEHLEKMLKAGVIQESTSDWAAAPVLIRKRDGTVRWCIDFRRLNAVTTRDVFPLPLVDDCLDTLSGSVWFSKLDANSAYWQVPVREGDRKKTAFITRYGLFEHVRMGFGLCGAPGTYARIMNLVFRGMSWKTVLAFLDDILVLGSSFKNHLQNLKEALSRFRQYGLKLKPKKCTFFQKEVEFLGRNITRDSLEMSEHDIKVVKDWPVPTKAKDVESFMGLVNYHRAFIKDFSRLAEPLYAVTGKKQFEWTEKQSKAFETLKEALLKPPVLALPNVKDAFILDTDASDFAIGAELLQVHDGVEKVIAYGSFAMTKEQRRYCTTRKELLAVVRFTRQYRHYLLGKPFVIRTDHSSLRWLMRFKGPQGQLARWLEELSQYNMVLQHRPGRLHGAVDGLSRKPANPGSCGIRPGDLPCGGCEYCVRAHKNWVAFTEDVDDVVPLAGNNLSDAQVAAARVFEGEGNGEHLHISPDELSDQLSDSGKTELSHRGFPERFSEDDMFRSDVGAVEQAHWLDPMQIQEDVEELQRVCEQIPWGIEIPKENLEVISVNVVTTRRQTRLGGQEAPNAGLVPVPEPEMSGAQAQSDEPAPEPASQPVTPQDTGDNEVPEAETNAVPGDSDPQVGNLSSSWGLSIEELRKAQTEDPDLKLLIDWMHDEGEPNASVLLKASPVTKSYWLNREQFLSVDGVLYINDPETDYKKLVLPKTMQETAMELHHTLPSAGHQGAARTRERLKEKFHWYGMKRDVTNYVQGCEVCNQNKKSVKHGKCALTEHHAGAPMERIHIDFLGPLPKTARGHEHVLMVVDQFTKWVECIPLPSQSAEVTAKAVVDQFFSRFGTPFEIFSDQGRNFDSKLFSEVCKVLEIHKARSTPYRPSSNGQVERYNRTLMDAVRCFIGKSQNEWDLHLQQIAGALRASVNRMTGFSANKLMLGREVNTPADLMFPQQKRESLEPDDHVSKLVSQLHKSHETARARLQTTSKRMKRDYDLRLLERSYEVGDAVYILDTAVLKGKCKKLCPPWKGPGVIVTKLSAYLFRVKVRNAVFVANHDRLKPCRDRKLPKWIEHWKNNPNSSNTETARGDDRVYCFCRNPWQGRFMIQCDYCKEWYHGACVNVTPTEALDIIRYKCGECKSRTKRNEAA